MTTCPRSPMVAFIPPWYACVIIPSRCWQSDRGRGDGLHDLGVARAATQVARDGLPYVPVLRPSAALEIRLGRHEHARSTDAALGATQLQERLLERTQCAS